MKKNQFQIKMQAKPVKQWSQWFIYNLILFSIIFIQNVFGLDDLPVL